MKNRKKMITTALIVLVLLLGVGYATVSSVKLNINGTAKAGSKELQVFYDGVNSGTVSGKVTTISSPVKTREATFTVDNMTLGETVTMTFEVKNYETDVNANLAAPSVTNTNENYFQVTASCDKTTLNAGDTATITVNVKLIKTPVTDEAGSTTVTVAMAASPVA